MGEHIASNTRPYHALGRACLLHPDLAGRADPAVYGPGLDPSHRASKRSLVQPVPHAQLHGPHGSLKIVTFSRLGHGHGHGHGLDPAITLHI